METLKDNVKRIVSDPRDEEIKLLKSQLEIVKVLMNQNSELEREIQRLNGELDECTKGIIKRGYLYKFRDREISYASRWGLRYFVLQGSHLSYYLDDRELRPRRTIDLTGCIVKEDGPTKNGAYHVINIYWPMHDDDIYVEGNLLMRLSSEDKVDAAQWAAILQKAANPQPQLAAGNNENDDSDVLLPTTASSAVAKASPKSGDDWDNTVPIGDDDFSQKTLQRVRSSTRILEKSQSRQGLSGGGGLDSPKAAAVETSKSRTSGKQTAGKKDKHAKEPKPRSQFPATKPIHVDSQSSPLSTETRPSEQNYRGFFNLGVIVLVISNLRFIIDSLMKYGFLVRLPLWNKGSIHLAENEPVWDAPQPVLAVLSYFVSILCSFGIEKLAARGIISEDTTFALNAVMVVANLVIPIVWVLSVHTNPIVCMIYLMEAVIIWMKLISYAHVNSDLRKLIRSQKLLDKQESANDNSGNSGSASNTTTGSRTLSRVTTSGAFSAGNFEALVKESKDNNAKPAPVFLQEVKDLEPPFLQYPQNITLKNLLYFMIIPTLCYQLNYPRSPKVRIQYILMYLLRMFLVSGLIIFITEQHIAPTLHHSLSAMQTMNPLQIAGRLLKLSVPNTYVWLMGFYWFFHLWLNLLAEITRFGDRQFYKDWWNSRTISNYWRLWNLPVHHWMLRHLYYPLLNCGASKTVATLLVFLFSAVFHEILISVPFRHFALHAFFGMLGQAPLIFITKVIDRKFDNAFIGNAIFWAAFCIVGQPMGMIMYYYDFTKAS